MTDVRFIDVPDFCDDGGAASLARKIADYWRSRGAPAPQFMFVRGAFIESMRRARVDLRSNMKNGFPQGFDGDKP